VEVFRITPNVYYYSNFSKFVECIAGSKVMKKVTLLQLASINSVATPGKSLAKMKEVVEACKKKKTVELWKENYTVNGKVDLDSNDEELVSG
jgi:hypothetical protein